MARDESDREDLLGEATALVRRAEIRLSDRSDPVFIGFKRDESFAVYLGSDPYYQFDPQNRLRRAFVGGLLYRTQGTTLASLTRMRSESKTVLQRVDLTVPELQNFLTRLQREMTDLASQLDRADSSNWTMIPNDSSVRDAIEVRLQLMLSRDVVLAPAIVGKR